MESDIKLKDGTVEITGDQMKADVGFQGGVIELTGTNLKTSVTNIDAYYNGGHLLAKDGNIEIGSTDGGTLKGFKQLKNGSVEITGSSIKQDVGFQGGTIELTGTTLKANVTNIEANYYGGHLSAKDGNLELGSTDGGTFKGYKQSKDGTIGVAGDKLKAEVNSAEIGSHSGGKFKGLIFSSGGVGCYGNALVVVNPDVTQADNQQRAALAQSSRDELVINANGNYKGGVKLDGVVNLSGDLVASKMQVNVGGQLLLMRPNQTIRDPRTGRTIALPVAPLDVLATITGLQDTIAALEKRIAVLESKTP